jgi:hypothetical protein
MAKGVRVVLKISFVALLSAVALIAAPNLVVHAQPLPMEQPPAYAKWGKMAVLATQKRYPNAKVVDYLHVGSNMLSPTVAQETFKLWLRQQNREFGVYVRIAFDTTSERVRSIHFQETDR